MTVREEGGAPWTVLLVGGHSGTGKSTVARRIGQERGVPWLQVDDLRLAFQRAGVSFPERTADLYHFLQPGVWKQSAEVLRDALIAVGEVMTSAIEVVVESHVHLRTPIVIEGDGILPSIMERPAIAELASGGDVQAVFLVETDEEVLFAAMLDRGRGFSDYAYEEQRKQVRTSWLFGQWIAAEASRLGLRVVASDPQSR